MPVERQVRARRRARLGDILNTHTEVSPTTAAQLPPIKGPIHFDAVSVRYRAEAQPVLHALTLDVQAGEVIGIVGRSGSGKSTLTKLVQRLYTPEQGRVPEDGIDISLIDAAQLRRQIELSVIGQTDRLVISNRYASTTNQIEKLRLYDGSKVLASEVQGLLSAMTMLHLPEAITSVGHMHALPTWHRQEMLAASV